MHATLRSPSATVSTALLGGPYGVFVGLRATVARPSFSKPLPTISASGSATIASRAHGVQRRESAPLAVIVHAAAEQIDVLGFDADEVHLRPGSTRGHFFHDEHRGVPRCNSDAVELLVQRTQRVAAVEHVVDDEHSATH